MSESERTSNSVATSSIATPALYQRLQELLANLKSVVAETETAAAHLLYGRIQRAGSSRYSAIKFWPRTGSELSEIPGTEREELEKVAFQLYVNDLRRPNLLLSFVEQLADADNRREGFVVFRFSPDAPSLITEHRRQRAGKIGRVLEFNSRLAQNLCPEPLVSDFIETLRDSIKHKQKSAELSLQMAERLEEARWKTLFYLKDGDAWYDRLPSSIIRPKSGLTAEAACRRFLQGLQGSLLFQIGSSGSGFFERGDFFMLYQLVTMVKMSQPKEDGTAVSDPVRLIVTLSPVVDKKLRSSSVNRVYELIHRTGGVAQNELKLPVETGDQLSLPANGPKLNLHGKFQRPDIVNQLKTVFAINVQANWALIIVEYLMTILQEIRGCRHEGKPLEFWLMVANASEMQDAEGVELLSFGSLFKGWRRAEWEQAVGSLAIPWSHSQKGKDAALAARILSAEHFPWFENGRYALLYDVSGLFQSSLGHPEDSEPRDEWYPLGLIKLTESSWDHYARKVFDKDPATNLPPNVLLFYDGLVDFGGVVVAERPIRGVGSCGLRFFARLVGDSFRKLGEDERLDDLITILTEDLEPAGLSPGEIGELARMVVRLAENPSRGGLLVILKKEPSVSFVAMGTPWDFRGNGTRKWEDLEALVSHDGATLLTPGKGNIEWSFRRLLSADSIREGERKEVRELLEASARRPVKDNPLHGAGSRRWSAALSAFCKDVKSVVAISQDGDIIHWRREGDALSAVARIFKLGQDKSFPYHLSKEE